MYGKRVQNFHNEHSAAMSRSRCWCGDGRPNPLLATDDRNCVGAQDGLTYVDKDSYATVYKTNLTGEPI